MRRNEWRFVFSAEALLVAAGRRRSHHDERAEFWLGEANAAEAAVRESGVELKTYPVSGGGRFEAHVDQTLGDRLTECRAKLRDHETQREGYERWIRALTVTPPAQTFELDVDDVAYFGL